MRKIVSWASHWWRVETALVAIAIGFGGGYWIRGWRSPDAAAHVHEHDAQPQAAAKEEAKVQWWTCSMHPQIKQPKPGRCPICGMELIPLKENASEEPATLRTFATSEAAKRLMDIQVSPVERKFVTATVRMVGKVDYDETRLAYISSWVPGRIDRLYVDYTGITVRKGDHMVYLYSPDLYATQQELLQALKVAREMEKSTLDDMKATSRATADAAREKLRLLGLTAEQVAEIEKRGSPIDHLTIYAPIGGIVIHKDAQEGMYVQTGTRIYAIADLSTVWVKLDAYETDLVWVRYGQQVTFTTEAYPGEAFTGRVAFIDPTLDAKTRTVKVRVNVPNADGKLKPEMFVRARVEALVAAGGRVMAPDLAGKWMCPMHPDVVKDGPGKCDVCGMPLVRTESLGYVPVSEAEAAQPLVIPATAPLVTGKRAVVYLQAPDADKPTFEGREIVLGPRAGDYYIVRTGLKEGDLVVTNGNFKIDSALQILARPSMMSPEGGGGAMAHHGGETPKQKGGEAAPMPAMTVPQGFKVQLRPVQAAAATIEPALLSGELDEARAAFKELGRLVGRVDASTLSGHMKGMWDELAMRLRNDSVIGGDVKSIDDGKRQLAEATKHVERLAEAFGLPKGGGPKPIKVPDAFRAQIASVLDGYLAMQTGLSKDDSKAASDALAATSKALGTVDVKLLDSAAYGAWMRELPSLGDALKEMAKAKDINDQRAGFALVSEALPPVLRVFGPTDRTLYIIRCPMAFNNRGATWVQPDKSVRNPYFGATMLTCGSVVETIGGTRPEAGGTRPEE